MEGRGRRSTAGGGEAEGREAGGALRRGRRRRGAGRLRGDGPLPACDRRGALVKRRRINLRRTRDHDSVVDGHAFAEGALVAP